MRGHCRVNSHNFRLSFQLFLANYAQPLKVSKNGMIALPILAPGYLNRLRTPLATRFAYERHSGETIPAKESWIIIAPKAVGGDISQHKRARAYAKKNSTFLVELRHKGTNFNRIGTFVPHSLCLLIGLSSRFS